MKRVTILLFAIFVVLGCGNSQNTNTITKSETLDASLVSNKSININNILPCDNMKGQIVKHKSYTLSYNESAEQPSWVVWYVDASRKDVVSRTNNFRPDPDVTTKSANANDYDNSGYDRGHMCNAKDMEFDATSASESFYMSNMCPQATRLNRQYWLSLETMTRTWSKHQPLIVIAGPVLTNSEKFKTIGVKNKVKVPEYFYKVIVTSDFKHSIGYVFKNTNDVQEYKNCSKTIREIETITGINFFCTLPQDQQDLLEKKSDLEYFK